MQNKDYVNRFTENIEIIKAINTKNLIRREELGNEMCFADAEEDIARSINLCKLLADIDISGLPDNKLHEINNVLQSCIGFTNDLKKFSAKSGDNERRRLINNFTGNYDNWYYIITPVIAFALKAGTDYEALQRKAIESNKLLNDELSVARKERQEAKQEIDSVVATVKKAASEVGVTQHATNFKDAADYFEKEMKYWLKCIIGIIGGIVMYSLLFFVWCPIKLQEPYNYTFLQSVMPRMTGLFALFYGLYVANYTYRAHAHNFIVNKNKQNALSTFETFVKAAEDNDTKSAVLLQTTKAIFSNPTSGYLKAESNSEPGSQIIEVVKNLSKD